MLKGRTTFELTDVNTGEIERFEDNNMFTNALNEVFNRSPFYFNNVLLSQVKDSNAAESSLTPTFKKALGGLLLFPNRIEEDANTIYAPADNKPVGIASNDAYSGTDERRGSFNEIESGIIFKEDQKTPAGYKFVWDFSTSQGNGAIACACLTSYKGGKGYLDGSDVVLHNTAFGNSYFISGLVFNTGNTGSAQDSDTSPRGYAFGADETGVYWYRPSNNKVYKYAVPENKLDLLADYTEYRELFEVETVGSMCKAPGGIWVIRTSGNSSGNATINIDKYLAENGFVKQTQTIVVGASVAASNENNTAAYVNGYLYLVGYDNKKVIKINLDNLADVASIPVPVAVTRLFCFGDMCSSSEFFIEQDSENTVHATSLVSNPIYRSGAWAIFGSTGTVYQLAIGASVFTPYLATINNLRTAIAKDVTKTLKVVYTVTIAE